MNASEFLAHCVKAVVEYHNERVDKTDNAQICEDDVFVVWQCKTLQNNKCIAL